jgi:hypothetical protein
MPGGSAGLQPANKQKERNCHPEEARVTRSVMSATEGPAFMSLPNSRPLARVSSLRSVASARDDNHGRAIGGAAEAAPFQSRFASVVDFTRAPYNEELRSA